MIAFFIIDWRTLFVPGGSLFEIVLRGTVMYLVLFAFLRFVLKHCSEQSSGNKITGRPSPCTTAERCLVLETLVAKGHLNLKIRQHIQHSYQSTSIRIVTPHKTIRLVSTNFFMGDIL